MRLFVVGATVMRWRGTNLEVVTTVSYLQLNSEIIAREWPDTDDTPDVSVPDVFYEE